MPLGFETNCNGVNCKKWDLGGTFVEVNNPSGTSWLQYTGIWVQSGSVQFTYSFSGGKFEEFELIILIQ